MVEEVSLDSTEEAERLVGWGCKVSLMDLQREIFLKIHAMKRDRDQKRISFKEGSTLQVRSLTSYIKQSRYRKTYLHIYPLNSINNWRIK